MSNCQIVSVPECLALMQQQRVQFIDVRDTQEYAHEHIDNALHKPLADLTADDIAPDKVTIFYCQSGFRTQQAQPQLSTLCRDELYILQGGLNAWKKAQQATIRNPHTPIPIMRQVQIIVGFMVVLGSILGFTVSPSFHYLSAFFGAGLLFAGLSGTCALASLLMRLPFNRAHKTESEQD